MDNQEGNSELTDDIEECFDKYILPKSIDEHKFSDAFIREFPFLVKYFLDQYSPIRMKHTRFWTSECDPHIMEKISTNIVKSHDEALRMICDATDGATKNCSLIESVAVLISQRDNARLQSDSYKRQLTGSNITHVTGRRWDDA
jgi:hypothetical protein